MRGWAVDCGGDMVLSSIDDPEWPWLERELGGLLAVSSELQECRHKLNQVTSVQLGLRLCHME